MSENFAEGFPLGCLELRKEEGLVLFPLWGFVRVWIPLLISIDDDAVLAGFQTGRNLSLYLCSNLSLWNREDFLKLVLTFVFLDEVEVREDERSSLRVIAVSGLLVFSGHGTGEANHVVKLTDSHCSREEERVTAWTRNGVYSLTVDALVILVDEDDGVSGNLVL